MPFPVTRATPDDAEEYVACHLDCLEETYAALMPPAFFDGQRAEAAERVAAHRRLWADPAADATSWLARDEEGVVVGVVSSGTGPQEWEVELGAPPTALTFELHHLYTRARTHGSGLGARLLTTALADRAAFLWTLHGNERAAAFYRRQGFTPDGGEMDCGPSWFHRPMYRMARPARSPA